MCTRYFIAYLLKKKDPAEYNGIESYVRGEVDKNSLEWVPSRTSFALQDQGKGPNTRDEAADAASEAALKAQVAAHVGDVKMDALLAQLAALQQAVTALQTAQS